jgi:uncharacterized iron-regulated membrane protein
MRGLRRALFWCHLTAGSAAGVVILTMCATGVLLAFQPQILRFAERRARAAHSPASAPRLPAGTLLGLAGESSPGAVPTAITVEANPSESAAVAFGRERTMYVDPATGAVLGGGSARWRGFFAKVQDVHRWLAVPEEDRAIGKAVTGAANVAFLGLALSGLYIWWPRLRGIRRVASVALFQRGVSGRARDFNWHNVVGVWSASLLIVITVTALPMSYRRAGDLVYRIAGSEPPANPAGGEARPRGGPTARKAEPISTADAAALDRLWRVAERQSPGWRAITMRIPEGRRAPITFTIEEGGYANRFARSTLILARDTGEIVKWEPYTGNAGRRVRSWMRFLHTGEALGVGGQIAAALASSGGILLAVTGLSLAWRRFRSWRARRTFSATLLSSPKPSTAGDTDIPRAKGAMS